MSSSPDPAKGTNNNKSKVYFIIGAAVLLAMGLLFAVDKSIANILLGVAVYFFFLGFYSLDRNKRTTPPPNDGSYARSQYQRRAEAEPMEGKFTTKDLWNLFKETKIKFPDDGTAQSKSRRAVKIFLIVFALIFTIPIIISVLGSGGDAGYALNYYEIAEQNYNAGQLDSAYRYYKMSIREDPDYEEAWVGYGKVLRAREQKDSAAIIFDKVLEMDPGNREATFFKAFGYYDQGRYGDGVSLLEPFLEDNSDYYDGMLLLGDFYYAQNQHAEALKRYEKAYEEGNARNVNLSYYMAIIYDEQKNYEKAIPFYQETLSYDSTMTDVYRRLGELIKDEKGNYYRAKAAELRR